MLAGQETSATALAWCLYALCENTEIQDKLRRELTEVESDEPSMFVSFTPLLLLFLKRAETRLLSVGMNSTPSPILTLLVFP